MKRRHEKGIALIAVVILICIFLMYILKNDLFGTVSINSTSNSTSNSNTEFLEQDISFTDASENTLMEEEQEDLWILFDQLQFEREDIPMKIMFFSVVLILYVICIGPVFYFILKKKDKMEWMWGMIPCAAILFAFAIMLVGDSVSIKEPVVDALTVITPGKKDVVYLASTSPGDEAYSLEFADMVDKVTPLYIAGEYKLYNDSVVQTDQDYSVNEEEGTITLNLKPREVFSEDYFRLQLDHSHKGRIKESFVEEEKVLSGTFLNHTEWDFEDVMIFYKDSYCVFSNVNAGEEVNVKDGKWIPFQDITMWDGPGMDCDSNENDNMHIINFAYFKYFEFDAAEDEYCIAGVIADHVAGVENVTKNAVSHGLYYQIDTVK